jgi:Serine/threonine protein kinase involved in cell cycle control
MPRKHSVYDVGSSRFDDAGATFERIKAPRASNAKASASTQPEEREIDDPYEILAPFIQDRWISDILHVVKSGKEATVYCCRAHPDTELGLIAAKVYRSRENRSFKNDAIYQEGRVVPDKRLRRAVEHKTRIGREVQFRLWIEHEFQTLRMLYGAGAQVAIPFASSSNAMLLYYYGDQDAPAPTLSRVTLRPEEARPLFERLIKDIEIWLRHGRVHADLSAFNILYHRGRLVTIDFPQSVDPRFNNNAYALLQRDISNICDYWADYGVKRDPERLSAELWSRAVDFF